MVIYSRNMESGPINCKMLYRGLLKIRLGFVIFQASAEGSKPMGLYPNPFPNDPYKQNFTTKWT